ncbi:hypothetical protein CAPTEDRAFT_213117 [Capitella teleta]|uniref:NADP-dependent oxidoreductase domain-containing protein n=1 Tax=Capitella teleta TaxID=283909 RepID=R7VIN1_CAPTE|nr:hypothetical protein CAPTEDRAFT_213117 [Capitella teleta]|eukprot:ELU18412.1 hypothetical protein CAPTEDRAFT_213117 [Capitella teleta]
MRMRLLCSGSRIPFIGLGTYNAPTEEVSAAVDCALTVGYRHIDGAAAYKNEGAIGNALHHHLHTGKLKRKDIFVTSKLPVYSFHSQQTMRQELEKSLELLKLSQIDLYLVHSPWGVTIKDDDTLIPNLESDVVSVWRTMEKFHSEGKVKSIGLSNFSIRLMDKILAIAKVFPDNLQLECHPYLQQRNLRKYCSDRNIAITAYAPLGSPGRAPKYSPGELPDILKEPKVLAIAKEIGKTPAQVLLAFLLQQGLIPLPKSTNPKRIEENFNALQCKLSETHMKSLYDLDQGVKYFVFKYAESHPDYLVDEEY